METYAYVLVGFMVLTALLYAVVYSYKKQRSEKEEKKFKTNLVTAKMSAYKVDDAYSACSALGFGSVSRAAILSQKIDIYEKLYAFNRSSEIDSLIEEIKVSIKTLTDNPIKTKIVLIDDPEKIKKTVKLIAKVKTINSKGLSKGYINPNSFNAELVVLNYYESRLEATYFIKALQKFNKENNPQAILIIKEADIYFRHIDFDGCEKFIEAFNKQKEITKSTFSGIDYMNLNYEYA